MKQPIKNKYVVGQEYYEPIEWDGEYTIRSYIYQGIVGSVNFTGKHEQLHQFRPARYSDVELVPLIHYSVRDALAGPLTSLELRKANMSRQLNAEKRKRKVVTLAETEEEQMVGNEVACCSFPDSLRINCRQDLETLVDRKKPVYLFFHYEPTIDDLELVAQISQDWGMAFEFDMAPKFAGTLEPLSGKENLKSLWISQIPDPEFIFLEMLETFCGLQVLNLCYSRISDQVGVSLTELQNLMDLDLSNTKITDRIKYDLAALSRLTNLKLDETQITDDFFRVEDLWPKLESLSLDVTSITDEGISQLRAFPALKELSLDGADITDASIPYLTQMKNLKNLSVEKTAITVRGTRELIESMADCWVRC